MKTISEKLDYINIEIKNTNINLLGNFNTYLNKAKEIKKDYYYKNRLKLKNLDSKLILKHSFASEVLSLAEKLEKVDLIKKIIKTKKISLERHTYAPELNKVKINNTTIEAPNVVTIYDEPTTLQKLQNCSALSLKIFLTRKSVSYLNKLILN